MPATHENLRRSEIMVAKLLDRLLDAGLQPARLDFGDMGLDETYFPFFDASLKWLSDAGIVRGILLRQGNGSAVQMVDATLTADGFACLGRLVPGASGRITVLEVVSGIAADPESYPGLVGIPGALLGSFSKSIDAWTRQKGN